jgi:predicted homoserine dehydrogenase-like protein
VQERTRPTRKVRIERLIDDGETVHMMHPRKRIPSGPLLQRLSALSEPIRIGLIGMGAMGKGLLYQSRATPGFKCVATADVVLEKAVACAQWMGSAYRVVYTAGEMEDAIRRGELAVCENGLLVATCTEVNVLIESSSAIVEAGEYSIAALEAGKHLVMMNAEADLIFGPYLMRAAHDRRLVYTSCDGDQHGVIKRLVDDLELWGFDLVMAGNIKGFLDRYSNPTTIIPEADARRLDYRMAAAYTDGTKLSVEMALVANALGLRTSAPGMYGPRAAHVQDVFRLFDFESLRTERQPCVDYILGAEPGGGVFAVGYCDHPYQQDMLAYYKMGSGPFYLFYRPYHLCHVEAMQCVAEAVLDGRSLLEPLCGFRTNVYAYAKRDLRAGEHLDGIGGYTCYGLIENCDGQAHPGLPICLAEGVAMRRDIRKDAPILLADVELPLRRADLELYGRAQAESSHIP